MSLSGSPLVEVAEAIGIGPDEVRNAEQPDHLRHTFRVRGSTLANLPESGVAMLQQTYGASLTLELRLGELTELKVDTNTTGRQLHDFLASVVSGNEYDVVIDLDKHDLLQRELAPPDAWQVRWFLFATTFENQLRQGLAHFEAAVWSEDHSRLLVLISDEDFRADGSLLHVLGGSDLQQAGGVLDTPRPDWALVDHIRDARERYISWEQTWASHLTPIHFDAAVSNGVSTALAALLTAQAAKLTVLFTCDRARALHRTGHTAEIRAEYRGQHYSTVVPIHEEMGLDDLSQGSLLAMNQLVVWCYRRETGELERDWVQNRLPFVQTRVAESLVGVSEDARLSSLVRFVPFLLEGLEWHWKSFIEDRVSEYLGKVRQLEDVVGRTVGAFAEQTASLTKGLSDSVLAAVAVLVGSFLAAAFEDPFNEALFRIAVLVYGGHVLLVPGLIGLSSQRGRFNAYKAEFGHELHQFRLLMPTERVDALVGDRVDVASGRFDFWFWIAAIGYLALASASVIAAALLPNVVG